MLFFISSLIFCKSLVHLHIEAISIWALLGRWFIVKSFPCFLFLIFEGEGGEGGTQHLHLCGIFLIYILQISLKEWELECFSYFQWMKSFSHTYVLLCILQISLEEDVNSKAFLILNEIILTLKDVSSITYNVRFFCQKKKCKFL